LEAVLTSLRMHEAEDASVMPPIANKEASVSEVQKLWFVKDRLHDTLLQKCKTISNILPPGQSTSPYVAQYSELELYTSRMKFRTRYELGFAM
jgi:hypothetical protein